MFNYSVSENMSNQMFSFGCLAIFVSIVSGCTFTQPSRTECTTDESCRAVFGPGALCVDEGFCTALEVNKRCSRAYPEDFFSSPEKYKDAIILGALYDYDAHLDTLQGSELAIREVNNKELNGLNGRPFVLISCDYGDSLNYQDGLDSLAATEAGAKYLVEQFSVPAIIGPRGSSRTKVAFQTVESSGVLVISPSATSPALTELEPTPSDSKPGLLWRTAPPDSLQGKVIAEDMLKRSERTNGEQETPKKVGIIFQTGSYGEGLKNVFLQEIEGAPIETKLWSYTQGIELSAAVGEAFNDDGIEEFLFISSDIQDILDFLNSPSVSAKVGQRNIFLADAAYSEQLLTGLKGSSVDLLENIRGTRPTPSSGPIFDTFLSTYQRVFNADASLASAFTPHAYDAAWLVIYGVAWAYYQENQQITGVNIAKGLRKVTDGEDIDITPLRWSKVRQSFEQGKSINVQGASGSLDYDLAVEETRSAITVWGVENKTLTSHYTVQPQ